MILSHDLSWNAHINNIVSKARKRLHMLYTHKRSGVSQSDLFHIYKSVIRPVMEYACPVWHSSLPGYLSDSLEMIKKRALRIIFPGEEYSDTISKTGLETHAKRRHNLCKIYFYKMYSHNHKLNHLLPEPRNMPYELRNSHSIKIPMAKTERYRKSFLPWALANLQNK